MFHRSTALIRLARARLQPLVERLVWGGERRERLFLRLLEAHYDSLKRRQWDLAESKPHFFDHRHNAFDLLAGRHHPFGFIRGYLAAEMVRPGDRVLDIGSGDGFFARRFFARRGARVTAIDVDDEAVRHARRHNADPRIRFELLDAVAEPFPDPPYDVVVWDGALGHFPRDTTEAMLEKIAGSLTPDGVFVGSESLGHEGHDHLQFFESLESLSEVLGSCFAHVAVRSVGYPLPGGQMREEAFWRCAKDPGRLNAVAWQTS